MTNPIDDQIEAKLIAKIAHHRLSIRTKFRNRHNVVWPELTYKTIIGDIRQLKMWLRIAERLDETTTPYATYVAKQLTNNNYKVNTNTYG
jgi:hypothetical protein